jgi:transposase
MTAMTSVTQNVIHSQPAPQPAPRPARYSVGKVVVGVDTHKDLHAAVVLDELGARLDDLIISADSGGYQRLEVWARGFGRVAAFGVEGTGSYGSGLASLLRRHGHTVIEVNRPDRRDRRQRGKTDLLDAENAARAVLNGRATATAKAATGTIEMLRQIKIAKDTAVKARTQAMVTLKALIVTTPAELREQLSGLSKMALIRTCAGLRPRALDNVLAAAKHTVRSLARRWLDLHQEISEHERHLATLTEQAAPQMTRAIGIGPDTAAELLIVAGDNPERVRSEAAWARLCGVAPVPASSGRTSRMRLSRGGHRQANSALYRSVIVRMRFHQPTIDYVARRTAEGKSKPEIIRCLKRYLAREIWRYLHPERHPHTAEAAG